MAVDLAQHALRGLADARFARTTSAELVAAEAGVTPADDLAPSDSRSACAYKGDATYWSIERDGSSTEVAWSYPRPLSNAVAVRDMICFFDEHVDVTIDGDRRERPRTPWS